MTHEHALTYLEIGYSFAVDDLQVGKAQTTPTPYPFETDIATLKDYYANIVFQINSFILRFIFLRNL